MNKKIQPKTFNVNVKCSTCNHEYNFESSKKDIQIDTCSNCHPFYSGENTYKRAAGRVEKFNQKYTKKTK